MISAKRIAQLAKKCERMAALGRKKRLTTMKPSEEEVDGCSGSTAVAGKGHCAMYTADGRRFEVPLAYLGTTVFTELLRLSQQEFEFTGDDGRITLPCDATAMEYVMRLLGRSASAEVEEAFLSSMVTMPCHYSSIGAPSLAFAVCSS
ncbi:hypothetical protein ACP4OV_025295 [Aristida adscensionis]